MCHDMWSPRGSACTRRSKIPQKQKKQKEKELVLNHTRFEPEQDIRVKILHDQQVDLRITFRFQVAYSAGVERATVAPAVLLLEKMCLSCPISQLNFVGFVIACIT